MKTFLVTSIVAGLLALPAFAQTPKDMSCADFTAMDSSGQMEAMSAMDGGMMSEEQSSDEMASDEMASDEMAMTAEDVAQACADHPELMVHDAMEAAKGG